MHIYKIISPTNSIINLIMQNINQFPVLEITVISAQDLKTTYSPFSHRIRPFVTLSSTARKSRHMKKYKTREDDKGGVNPTWGDKFQICLDHTFVYQSYPGIYLRICTNHLLMGETQLGWCVIPAADILNRFLPVESTRFLSYRLRDRDGSRGHGVVNVAVKLISNSPQLPEKHDQTDQTVIGIPVLF